MAKSLLNRANDGTKSMPVGLVSNAPGIAFQCGTCEYFSAGKCQNENPALNGKPVKPEWCCNLYDHEDMKVIIR